MFALLLEHLAVILPACTSVCSAGCISACPAFCISARLVARLSVWRSARSLVCSSGCIWQQVWSHINLPGILSACLPVLQAVHLAAHSGAHSARLSIWSSAGLFCCLQASVPSICLFHRPCVNLFICRFCLQAMCHSGRLFIQLHLAASGNLSVHLQVLPAGHGFVNSSAVFCYLQAVIQSIHLPI
jgi:hypothetical protein